MIRSYSCLTNGFHIVHETTREFINKLPIRDHTENDPALCIIVFSLHIAFSNILKVYTTTLCKCSNVNVSPLLTFQEGTQLMAADGYLFKHIDLKDKRQIPDWKQCMSHILPPDLVTYKTSAKLDKHRDVFFIDPRKLHEKKFFHYIQYRIKNIICKLKSKTCL